MANQRTKGVDRISDLPDSILHHILSFMKFSQIAQTSVLSKRWEMIWRTYPVIQFDDSYWESGENDVDFTMRRNERFKSLVESVCNRHKDMIDLKKFKLRMHLFDDKEFTPLVDQSVYHAIGCNVKELELILRSPLDFYDDEYCILPQTVLFAKSLEILRIEGCRIEPTRSDLNLSSLRKLTLSHVKIDGNTLKDLVGCCSSIEFLDLHSCMGCETIELSSLPRLYEFQLCDSYNLERIDIRLLNVRTVEMAQISCEINLASFENLTKLRLLEVSISDEWLYDLVYKLPVLGFLCIGNCNMLRVLRISSSSLEKLELHICDDWTDLKINTPNLRHIEFLGAMTSLSLNARYLSTVKFSYPGWNCVLTQNYIEFLANLNHLKALNLSIWSYEYLTLPRELRQSSSSPLCNLEELHFVMVFIEKDASIAKLIDCLLWIAPHTRTISVSDLVLSSRGHVVLQFKFTYKKQMMREGGEEDSCWCKSEPISCWYGCMERVDVEFKEGSNLMKCSLEGEGIWEKIEALANDWLLSTSA